MEDHIIIILSMDYAKDIKISIDGSAELLTPTPFLEILTTK